MLYLSIFYDVIYGIGLCILLPFFWKRLFGRDKVYHDFLERLGVYKLKPVKLKKRIWIHTVSIGELLASLPLIFEIHKRFKGRQIVVSCVSRTGRIVAEQRLPEDIDKVFLPFDFSFSVFRAISKIRPEIFISIETEIWPNLFTWLKKHNVPIIILNGRISERSFKRYSAFRFFLRNIFNMVDFFVMRSQVDAIRIAKLGVNSKKFFVSKSIKFDQAYQLSQKEVTSSRTIVFGSIHKGEEEPVSDIVRKILARHNDVSIVIVPRALDRTNIFQVLNLKGIKYEKLSDSKGNKRVLVVDSYGLLTEFYRSCCMAFVGGSLVPAGGQNPIEPVAFRKVVLYGKFHWDFEQEWKKIVEAGGGIEVDSFDQLYEKIEFLLNNPEICKKMGEAGFRAILENKGATEEMLNIIKKYIEPCID